MDMPWGKYRGRSLAVVPASYLAWVLEELDIDPILRAAIRRELTRRFDLRPPPPPPPPMPPSPCRRCVELAERWPVLYRRLSAEVHPDRGGSTSAMRLVNELNDLLRR
jgi:hypothetical protein